MDVNTRNESAYEGLRDWAVYDQYSGARRALDLGDSVSWWWLRSPGLNPNHAAYVFYNGLLRLSGRHIDQSSGGIRPALWLYLE